MALRRALTVHFEVVGESGPPHMRTFITACVVGPTRCKGEGASKKVSFTGDILIVITCALGNVEPRSHERKMTLGANAFIASPTAES